MLRKFISAYRKPYRFSHVLTRLIESLFEKMFVVVVLTDLSKAFDSILHDLLVEKIHAYGFSKNSIVFYSYFKRRKQNVKINNTHSIFQILLSGLPQGSIMSRFYSIYL